jgi:hypothetical protein
MGESIEDNLRRARNEVYRKARKHPGCGGVAIGWDKEGNNVIIVNALDGNNNEKMLASLPERSHGVAVVVRRMQMGELQNAAP